MAVQVRAYSVPYPFVIFTNDFPTVAVCVTKLFADDTAIYKEEGQNGTVQPFKLILITARLV